MKTVNTHIEAQMNSKHKKSEKKRKEKKNYIKIHHNQIIPMVKRKP